MGQIERNKRTTWLQLFWFSSDVLAILAGFLGGYALRFSGLVTRWIPPVNEVPPRELYLVAAVVTVCIWIPLFYALGLYRIERGRSRHRRGDLLRGLALGALVLATVGFFYRGASFSRVALVLTWVLTSGFVLVGRSLVYGLRRRLARLVTIRFAVVGGGPVVRQVVDSLSGSSFPHECLGRFVLGSSRRSAEDGASKELLVLGTVDEIASKAEDLRLDLVVMSAGTGSPELMDRVFHQCQRVDLDFQYVPDVLSLWGRHVHVEDVDGIPLLRLRDLRLSGWNGVAKRTLDLLASTVLLLALSPLLLAIAILVKSTSPGPVFHRQVRVGRDRRPFEMLKFRSMRADAEKETGPVWASANDPRRTPLGTFLRKWSLDELPQFWNVFKGEMSLVGPRPERPHFVEEFETVVQDYYDRHRVKSGVTGWAQVHGLRGNVPIEQRTAYDLYYVENWSLWLDLRILWLTLWAVVAHRGE